MEIQILKQEYLEAIRKDPILKGAIAVINKVSTDTIDRWRRENNPMLTTITSLKVIRERLKLNNTVELTEPQQAEFEIPNIQA